MYRFRLPLAAALLLTTLAGCGGGGDGTTSPSGVARVEVTAPSPSMEVGASMLVTTRYFDGKNAQLSGRTVSYTSSSATVATVQPTGLVTALATGSVTITATVDGKSGTVSISVTPVPVASVAISPTQPSVRQGDTTPLTAQPLDAIGRPLTGRTITWSSADESRATINASSGVVTGVSPGNVYIRAEAEGKRDSVVLRVKSLNAPVISSTSQAQLTPGATGTINGANFGAAIAENQVFVNGVAATVTAASATAVSFTVPAATALPCTPTGPAQIVLVANADTAITSMPLRMATQRTLAVGASVLYTTPADLMCNEFAGTGGRYLITAFNYAPSGGTRTSFQLLGASTQQAASVAAAPALQAPVVQQAAPPRDERMARHVRAHVALLEQERSLARSLGAPKLRARAQRSSQRAAALNLVVNPPPSVGDMVTYRMRRTINSTSTYDEVRFRAVYVGPKLIIFEDSLSALAGTMDAEYQKIGQEFDDVMYQQLKDAFGDPLVVDSALDNNGHLIALFSPRVNNYTINGVSNAILGFVTICDYFPRVPTQVGNITIPACPSSNEAEAFYAIVPNPSAGFTLTEWQRYMRGTFIHEAKHIASYAWRYYYDAEELEETWLEEATAQQASEIWARSVYGRAQGQDIKWSDGPRCDYSPVTGACPDPAEGILHHFSFLYDHYNAHESKSILDDPLAPIDPVIYGSSWSFARWVTDVFGSDEGTFLQSINKVKNDHGVLHLAAKAGRPFSELLGLWSLATLADNYPGATITDTRLRLPSWDTRDLFAQMNQNLVLNNGSPAYPKAWPLGARQVTFGTFTSGQRQVNDLKGGGFVAWELSGTQTAPQVLAIRSATGGLPAGSLGLAIVRVQ